MKNRRFTIKDDVLFPPEEYKSVIEAINNAQGARPFLSDHAKPCLFIPEFKDRFVQNPEQGGIVVIQNYAAPKPNFEPRPMDLIIFWAFDEKNRENVLVVWDGHDRGVVDERLLWTTVSDTEWHTTPLGLHAVRRFENVNAAKAECPDGSDERIIVLQRKDSNGWRVFEVHSPFNDTLVSVGIIMNPDVLDKELGIPEHVWMPVPDWERSVIDGNSPLNKICPGLIREKWPDTVEGVVTPPQVLMIGVIAGHNGMLSTSGYHGLVIVTYRRIEGTNVIRICWRVLSYDYSRLIFPSRTQN